jgi:hypothetical protein
MAKRTGRLGVPWGLRRSSWPAAGEPRRVGLTGLSSGGRWGALAGASATADLTAPATSAIRRRTGLRPDHAP